MIAIIPARGGSKGLPGKNTRSLNGKPLIAYSIDAALESKYIDRVIVSTDSKDIAEVAKLYGAEVPFIRPDYLAEDESLAIDNYIHIIQRLSEESGTEIEEFCVLQPTSPLRESLDIDAAIEIFYERKADSVISYCIESHPVYWHKFLSDDGKLIDIFSDNSLKNRQEMKPSYYPNGAVYVFKTSLILLGEYYSDETYTYIMPKSRSIDIDYLEDFNYAEYLLKV